MTKNRKGRTTLTSVGFTINMKKQTKIIKDKKQTRTTVPAELVREKNVKTGDLMEWEIKEGKLKGELKQ